MQQGFLTVETDATRAGMVRLGVSARMPASASDPDPRHRLCYAARFNDSEAALMHAHELLKRRLVDIDAHLYRVSPERAVGAIESLALQHSRTFLDPAASDGVRDAIDAYSAAYRRRRARRDQFFETLGYIGIALLLLNLLAFSFA